MFIKMKLLTCFGILASLMLLGSCTNAKKQTPQETLSEYVSRSFGVATQNDKAKLAELATGQVKAALDSLNDEEFKKNFVDTKRELVALKIKDERKLADGRYSITYEIAYINKSSENKDKLTSKKHAIFVNENGKWLVSEVQNLKTVMEHQTELEVQADPKTKANF